MEPPMFHGRLKDGRRESGDRDTYPTERFEAQYQNFKSQQHQLHGTSSHRDLPVAREGILLDGDP